MTSNRSKLSSLYLLACIYRVMNALAIQTQFDADEYWQCLEPAYCLAFSSDGHGCAFTWEWTRRFEDDGLSGNNTYTSIMHALKGPVRSFLPVLPTYALYVVAKWFRFDTPWIVSRGPLVLNAILVAAPTDLAVVSIARWVTKDHVISKPQLSFFRNELSSVQWWVLIASFTSWFNGYALIRTYSNSMESMLLAVGLALLCPELAGSTARYSRLKPASALAFILGGMSLCVRFTAIAAWVPIGLLCCIPKKSLRDKAYTLFVLCAAFGIVGLLIGMFVDRIFYGFWAIPFLGSFHFNVILGKGSLYGAHHALWYFFAGIPAISGALLPLFVLDSAMAIAEKGNRAKSRQILVIIVISYVALHSFSAHKEFRFILPVLPLICILSGHALAAYVIPRIDNLGSANTMRWRRFWLCYAPLIILNYPHLWFLISIHQRGSIEINRAILARIQQLEGRKEIQTSRPSSYYNIHYFLGCHATPLYSHLHLPNVNIDAWTLDCSPQCRADPNLECESDRFQHDPLGFLEEAYVCGDEGMCRDTPDFFVISGESLSAIVEQELSNVGFIEYTRVIHEMSSVNFAKDALPSISFRHLVLFQDKNLAVLN